MRAQAVVGQLSRRVAKHISIEQVRDRLPWPARRKRYQRAQNQQPDNKMLSCPQCGNVYARAALAKNLYVCRQCGYHLKISAYYRLSLILDSGTARELERRLVGMDPLSFPGYEDKISMLRQNISLTEAVVSAVGRINGQKAVVAALDSRFLMGSMGVAVGEKITRTVEYATRKRMPLIIFSASGGARMQEGIFSLMQMGKVSAALERHSKEKLLFISVFTNPTMGGVTASFASLGDILLAEPGAMIGFAGPRVIEQTIGQKLPDGFQTAEYFLEHGFLDAIVERSRMKETLSILLRLHRRGGYRAYEDGSEQ